MKQPIPFGKYLLLERINVGGMAEIFLARSRGVHGFKRILAIKKILPTMAEDEEFIAMFVDEARIAAELSHACIVQIFELGRFEEDYYIAMEFVHGKDLRYIQERMAREQRKVPVLEAAFIAHKICEALDYAHAKKDPTGRPLGIIHRDVSPQNVIISYEGEVKICDFGIAKAANRSQKTQAGVLKGKFGYMSPEQVRGLPLDGRSDLFTVGTLLYEMVTLERLFVGESDFSTLEKVRNADVVPPSTYNRDVPDELEDIILKALAKEVEDRFQSASEFGDALQTFMLNQDVPTSRDLAAFTRDSFAAELEAELARFDGYQHLPEVVADSAAAAEPGSEEAKDQDQKQVDLEAKTLIFATTQGEQSGVEHLSPTPVRSSKQNAQSSWERKVAPATSSGSPQALTDAKTMLFNEPKEQPEEDLHEMPTRGLVDRPDLRVVEAPEKISREVSRPQIVTRRDNFRERLFLPLAVVASLLLGWSVFTTFRLIQSNPGSDSSARFKLITWPATGVKVTLDGEEVTTVTPFEAEELSPGVHHLKIHRSGFDEINRKFEVQAGTNLVMELALSKSSGGKPPGPVEKPPPPEVKKPDDKPKGAVKVKDSPKPPEKKPDKPKVAKLTKVKDTVKRPTNRRKSKAKKTAELVVESDPPGALVLLDGKRIGLTPLRNTKIRPRSSARVVLALKGYRNSSRKMEIIGGQTNVLKVVLTKSTRTSSTAKPGKTTTTRKGWGYLVANTRPWSKVYIDGRYTKRETPIAPDKKLKLRAGKHKVVFETPKGKKYSFDVVIEPGKVLKLIKRLE